MTKNNVSIGQTISYNGTKYLIVGIYDLYIEISAIGFQTKFKIGNEHLRFFTV